MAEISLMSTFSVDRPPTGSTSPLWTARSSFVRACAGMGNTRALQKADCFDKPFNLEIEHVIVRKAHRSDVSRFQDVDGGRFCAKVERLVGFGPLPRMMCDRAFEVGDNRITRPQ